MARNRFDELFLMACAWCGNGPEFHDLNMSRCMIQRAFIKEHGTMYLPYLFAETNHG